MTSMLHLSEQVSDANGVVVVLLEAPVLSQEPHANSYRSGRKG